MLALLVVLAIVAIVVIFVVKSDKSTRVATDTPISEDFGGLPGMRVGLGEIGSHTQADREAGLRGCVTCAGGGAPQPAPTTTMIKCNGRSINSDRCMDAGTTEQIFNGYGPCAEHPGVQCRTY